jgi:hypothetical protein
VMRWLKLPKRVKAALKPFCAKLLRSIGNRLADALAICPLAHDQRMGEPVDTPWLAGKTVREPRPINLALRHYTFARVE